MELKRFFIHNLDLEEDNTYELGKDDYNYMVNVMRLKKSNNILINNNTEYDFLCEITEVNKNKIQIKVLEQTKNKKEASVKVTVCQALVKNDKLELITQKITELGATKLIPFSSQFTVVKEHTQKTERLNKIAEQASSQCGRSKTLEISSIEKLKELPNLLKNYDLVLLAYEKSEDSLKNAFDSVKTAKDIAIIIGSEGGFSEEEVTNLKQSLPNLKVVSLGSRILRAETASIVLTSIVMYEMGELSE